MPAEQQPDLAINLPAVQKDDEDAEQQSSIAVLSDGYRASSPFITRAMQAFAWHWAHHRNQVKAYVFAYPSSTENAARREGGRLFRDPRVQAEIARVLDSWTAESGVTLAQLEQEVACLARSDIRRLFDRGFVLKDPHDWDPDMSAAVASYKETITKEGITRTVRLWDKNAAARTLMDAKGAFDKNKAPPGAAAIFNINLGGRRVTIEGGAERQQSLPGQRSNARGSRQKVTIDASQSETGDGDQLTVTPNRQPLNRGPKKKAQQVKKGAPRKPVAKSGKASTPRDVDARPDAEVKKVDAVVKHRVAKPDLF